MVVQPYKMWTCDLCGKVFQQYTSLQGHRRIHSRVYQYHCSVNTCAKTFCTMSQFQAHRRSHIDKRIYNCRTCGSRFLTKGHHLIHTCSTSLRKHRCRTCGKSFSRILSLAHHVKTQHSEASSPFSRRITTVIKLKDTFRSSTFKDTKKARIDSDGSDKDKILLKIQDGKSMTIISPMKSFRSEKKSKCRKKSKKKKKKEEKEGRKNGIILSIKNGSVNLPCEKRSDSAKSLEKKKTKVKEVGVLKLKIKSYPEMPQVERSSSSQKKKNKKLLSKGISNGNKEECKKNSLLDSDSLQLQKNNDSLLGNKIVIQKDKSGKLLAKPLSKAKVKRKDRDNVFDTFSAGTWKVMPSPRTDSPLDGLKLKLSPHKPIRLDSGLDCSMESAKCLDNILKSRVDVSDESDLFEGLPVGDKLESPANTVNDSGIEVLSSSSCNRSNENSVRSVIMDENSPSYINIIEDSLLSVDSPESVKSTPMLCPRCGGVVQEANNNTRSPGKCRCSDTSNPNSPFQTPVSPIKMNIHSSDIYRSHEHLLDSESHKSKANVASVSGSNYLEMPSTALTSLKTKFESVSKFHTTKADIEHDLMIVSKESPAKDINKLKLKLRTRKPETSPKQTDSNNPMLDGSTLSYNLSKVDDKVPCISQDLSVCSVDNTVKPSADLAVSTELEAEVTNNDARTVAESVSKCEKSVDPVDSPPVPRRKPIFKSRKSIDTSQPVSHDSEESKSDKLLKINNCALSPTAELNKKPLFKKRNSVDNTDDVIINNKKPIFRKRDLSLKRSFTAPVKEESSCALLSDKETDCQTQSDEPVCLDFNDKSVNKSSKEVTKEHCNIFSSFSTTESKDGQEILSITDSSTVENLKTVKSGHSSSLEKDSSTVKASITEKSNDLKTEKSRNITSLGKDSSTVEDSKTKKSNNLKTEKSRNSSTLEKDSSTVEDSKTEKSNDLKTEKSRNSSSLEKDSRTVEDSKTEKSNNLKTEKSRNSSSLEKDSSTVENSKTEKRNKLKTEKSRNSSNLEKDSSTVEDFKTEKSNDLKPEKSSDLKPGKSSDLKPEKSGDSSSLKVIEEKGSRSGKTNLVREKSGEESHDKYPSKTGKDKGNDSAKQNSSSQERKNIEKITKASAAKLNVKSKQIKAATDVKGVAAIEPGEDESLPPILEIEVSQSSPKPASKSSTSPLDLFQQQFLSFLSSNKPVTKVDDSVDKSSTKSHTENKCSNERKSQSAQSSIKHKGKVKDSKKKDSKKKDAQIVIEAAFSDSDDFDLKEPSKKDSGSDSFSWLKIFSDKTDKDAESKMDCADNKTDVDFKDDLAAITRKMDNVDDEDSNSLDVDDVFESRNLSSLQPKELTVVDSFSGKFSGSKSVKRPQTAKCSSGRLKKLKAQAPGKSTKSTCRNKAIHINESSGSELDKLQSDSDPDFNPFNDSDEDFVVSKPVRQKDRLSRSSKGRQSCESFGETESNVSERSKRSKQGRKSCCPCCLGSPRKSRISEHEEGIDSAKHAYKLPRRHNTFVRSSLQLLQLQEKIHTLFLTLFPDCAEIISKSKVGTAEFEALIDDVLYGLEGERCEFSPSVFMPSDTLTPQPFDKAQDTTMCHNDPNGLICPSTQGLLQLSDHSAASIDLQSIERDSHILSPPLLHSSTNTQTDLHKHGPNARLKDTSNRWLNAPLDNSDSAAARYAFSEQNCCVESSGRVLHNSTETLNTGCCRTGSVAANEPASGVCVENNDSHTAGLPLVPGADSALGMSQGLSHEPPLTACPGSLQAPESELPSELVITIDLDAARVSLCREPKDCLQRLHHRMVRLARCCLPKLTLNKIFYKNLDNVEFLIDMMIKANEGVKMEDLETSEDEVELDSASANGGRVKSRSRSRSCTPLNGDKVKCLSTKNKDASEIQSKIKVKSEFREKPEEGNKSSVVEKGLASDAFAVNMDNAHPVRKSEKLNKVEERVPVLSKYQEQFELEIKSKRESLRKEDVIDSEEEDIETVYKSPEEVLSSLQSLNKKFSRRRCRDSRLRKRSADEKRTLFVQEKIMNNQNSSIVYSNKFTNRDLKPKAARQNRRRNTKRQFLSELNLGDKLVSSPADSIVEEVGSVDSPSLLKDLQCPDVIKEEPESVEAEETDEMRRERSISGDKNIFELMQPVTDPAAEETLS